MENYRYWKDGDLDIRTCVGCHASQARLTETEGGDEIWVMYATNERLIYWLSHNSNPPPCPHCEEEQQKDMAAYCAKRELTETDRCNNRDYNLFRKMYEKMLNEEGTKLPIC